MSRPREYDRQKVLQKATRVFWDLGYEATSVSALVEATGLNTASMYKEFGNKEELFCAVMESAWQREYRQNLAPLETAPAGWPALRAYLEVISRAAQRRDFRGCLYMNLLAQTEVAPARPLRKTRDFCQHLRALLTAQLEAARAAGELPPHAPPAALAELLLCFLQGLTLYARVDRHKARVPRLIEDFLASLRR